MTRFVVSHIAALLVAVWLLVDGLDGGPWWVALGGALLFVGLVVEIAFYMRRGDWRDFNDAR